MHTIIGADLLYMNPTSRSALFTTVWYGGFYETAETGDLLSLKKCAT